MNFILKKRLAISLSNNKKVTRISTAYGTVNETRITIPLTEFEILMAQHPTLDPKVTIKAISIENAPKKIKITITGLNNTVHHHVFTPLIQTQTIGGGMFNNHITAEKLTSSPPTGHLTANCREALIITSQPAHKKLDHINFTTKEPIGKTSLSPQAKPYNNACTVIVNNHKNLKKLMADTKGYAEIDWRMGSRQLREIAALFSHNPSIPHSKKQSEQLNRFKSICKKTVRLFLNAHELSKMNISSKQLLQYGVNMIIITDEDNPITIYIPNKTFQISLTSQQKETIKKIIHMTLQDNRHYTYNKLNSTGCGDAFSETFRLTLNAPKTFHTLKMKTDFAQFIATIVLHLDTPNLSGVSFQEIQQLLAVYAQTFLQP